MAVFKVSSIITSPACRRAIEKTEDDITTVSTWNYNINIFFKKDEIFSLEKNDIVSPLWHWESPETWKVTIILSRFRIKFKKIYKHAT